MFTGARGLHRCVQRKNVGLKAMPSITPMMSTMRRDEALITAIVSTTSCTTLPPRAATRLPHRPAGWPGGHCGALHRLGKTLHRHRSLLQRGRLLLGALRQVAVALRDFSRTHGDGVGRESDLPRPSPRPANSRLRTTRQSARSCRRWLRAGSSHPAWRQPPPSGLRHGALHGLVLVHLRGDVGGILHDLERLSVEVQDGVVGSLIQTSRPSLPRRRYWPASYSPRPSFSQNWRYSTLLRCPGSTTTNGAARAPRPGCSRWRRGNCRWPTGCGHPC